MSLFAEVESVPLEVVTINEIYNNDEDKHKINLYFGKYAVGDLEEPILPVVQKVEEIIAQNDKLNRHYIPILGLPSFCDAAIELLLGANSPAIVQGRCFGVQSISSTFSLRLAAEFLNKILNLSEVCFSDTGEAFQLIFGAAGFKRFHSIRYWDKKVCQFANEQFLEDIQNAPNKSVIIINSNGFNVVNTSVTKERWMQIIQVIKSKNMFPVFYCGFQGLASGDLDEDAWTIRLFVDNKFEMMCSQSFGLNFGLHHNPVSNLAVVLNNTSDLCATKSQFQNIVQSMYGSPQIYGALIITHILNSPHLFDEWKHNVRLKASRINHMKNELRCFLEMQGTPGDWAFITNQIGIYFYTGLNEEQCERMAKVHHIYIHSSGRINMCAVTSDNVAYIARAMNEVICFDINKILA